MRRSAIFIRIVSLMVVAIMVAGCHSSRTVTRGSSAKKSTTPPPATIEKMRSDATSRSYEFDIIAELIREAAAWLGTPYQYAGHSRQGTDCSGFVMEIFDKVLGAKLPRSSRDQDEYCRNIKRDKLVAGDLIFFATGSDPKRVSHVGLYIGNGDMIHASASRGVIISNLEEKYYDTRFLRGGRPNVIDFVYQGGSSLDKKARSRKKNKEKSQPVQQPLPYDAESTATAAPTSESVAAGVSAKPTAPAVSAKPDTPAVSAKPANSSTAPKQTFDDQALDSLITSSVDSIFTSFFD